MTAHAFAWSRLAAATIARSADPGDGLPEYWALMQCSVRKADSAPEFRASLIDAAWTKSEVPSFDPPSALRIATRSRGKYFSNPARTACTTWAIVLAWL